VQLGLYRQRPLGPRPPWKVSFRMARIRACLGAIARMASLAVSVSLATGFAGTGLCAELPSVSEPSAASVTYTPIIRRDPDLRSPASSQSRPPEPSQDPNPERPGTVVPPGTTVLTPAPPTALKSQSRDSPSGEQSSIMRLMFNLGLGSPIGLLGGTLTFSPWTGFQIELGLGLGLSGVQLSGMPKLSVGSGQRHFVLGAGPSIGIGNNPNPSQLCISYWLNAEVGYEIRSESGSAFLLAFGVVSGLAGQMPGYGVVGVTEQGEAVKPEPVTRLPIVLPAFRIAWGHWF
jgi:hypothetical protein